MSHSVLICISFKELRNYKRKLFLCQPQKLAKTQPTFQNCCFSQYIYTSSHQTKYLHIENWICLSQAVFFCLLTSRNAKKTQTDQSMPRVFLQETTHKPLKVASAKSLFSSVYVIGKTCFGECFSFYVITKRHYFSWKFIVALKLF